MPPSEEIRRRPEYIEGRTAYHSACREFGENIANELATGEKLLMDESCPYPEKHKKRAAWYVGWLDARTQQKAKK